MLGNGLKKTWFACLILLSLCSILRTPVIPLISDFAITGTPSPLESNFLPLTQNAPVYYVSTIGDDSNDGSLDRPWRTVQHAVDNVPLGAIVAVRGGSYYEAVQITRSGEPGKPFHLTGFNGETVTINGGSRSAITAHGSYWNISSLTLTSTADRTIWLEPVSHWQLVSNNIVGAVVIIGDNNRMQGNEVDGSQHIGNQNGIMDGSIDSHHNQYIGNTVHDFTNRGIWSQWNTHDITISYNNVYNITGPYGACIDLDSAVGVTYRNFVRNNIVHDCGSIGIELENSFETIVENNLVYNTGVEGIVAINYVGCEVGGEDGQYGSPDGDCRGVSLDTVIRQNIIYNGGTTGGIVGYASAGVKVIANVVEGGSSVGLFLADNVNWCNNWEVYDNIFSNQRRAEISVYNPASLTVDQYNLLYHPGINSAYQVFGVSNDFYTLSAWQVTTGKGQNSIESNPQFINEINHDFHLQPGSPGVDHGTDPGISTDFEGRPRPRGSTYDIGAYERSANNNLKRFYNLIATTFNARPIGQLSGLAISAP